MYTENQRRYEKSLISFKYTSGIKILPDNLN